MNQQDLTIFRTNSYFAALVEEKLFLAVAIGRGKDPTPTLPQVAVRHMRYLTLYKDAFKFPSQICSQIQLAKIGGIRCDGAASPFVYWKSFSTTILDLSISYFALNLGFVTLTSQAMRYFESAMRILSHTVCVGVFSVSAVCDIYQQAFKIIKDSFYKLRSIELTHLPSWNGAWMFQRDWRFIRELQTLRIGSSRLLFSLLTDFIAYASTLVNLTIEDCIPEDASDGVALIGLEENRNFNHLSIPSQYEDGLDIGTILVFRYSRDEAGKEASSKA
jgi:hypothetical protein